MDAVASLLTPRSIAVIGASADPAKTTGKPTRFLRRHGFSGTVYPVNPRANEIDGWRCYPSVESLPEPPDVGLVLLGPDHAAAQLRALSARGAKAAIVLAGGYSETGESGATRQAELRDAAGHMRLLGPNTIGLVNVTASIPLSASGALAMDAIPSGAIGIVSQSGGILGSILSRAVGRGIGLSTLVATGNEADLDLSDMLAALADDPATRVVALYIEAIRDPVRFKSAVERVHAAGKPMVAYKVGRSESGARAAISHTGAMAGNDDVYDAVLHQYGIIRAGTFDDLLDVPLALSSGRRMTGNRVAILTSTGGAGTLVADNLGLRGMETPPPDPATAERLGRLPIGDQAVLDRNPIDVTLAGLRPEILKEAVAALVESSTYDAVAVVVGSSGVSDPDLMASALGANLAATTKPLVAYVSPYAPRATARLTELGIPAFASPESCAAALDGLRNTENRTTAWAGAKSPRQGDEPRAEAPMFAGPIDESAARTLFAAHGIPSVAEVIVSTPEEATSAAKNLAGPLVLKVLSSEIQHKTEAGGVALDLNRDTVGAALSRMIATVKDRTGVAASRFILQEQVTGGCEMILGFRQDPLGTVILVGAGGIAAELLQDRALAVLPPGNVLSADEAEGLVRRLRTFPLLDGYRGRPKSDLKALARAIADFSRMAATFQGRLLEAEINPLIVLGVGKGVRAADGLALFRASPSEKAPEGRRAARAHT